MSDMEGASPFNGVRPGQTAFVLVHGAWHGAWCYGAVVPELAKLGHFAVASDLPGHGVKALFPSIYTERPTDAATFSAAFASEASPLASLTVDDYSASVIDTIKAVEKLGFQRIVLVGHSLGGVTITRVAEVASTKLLKIVYLAGFMLPPGDAVIDHLHPDSRVGSVLVSDPVLSGAMRIDFASNDRAYRRQCREAFFGDCTEAQSEAARNLLTPDEPSSVFVTPSDSRPSCIATRVAMERHYIRCIKDRAIPVAAQDRMIAETDAALGGATTVVHSMNTSHSPFLSQPKKLAELLAFIAEGLGGKREGSGHEGGEIAPMVGTRARSRG
jgi:pimeloyl-ACP methyl ester carboxylesterase